MIVEVSWARPFRAADLSSRVLRAKRDTREFLDIVRVDVMIFPQDRRSL